jgi:hypothetical protein
MRRRDGKRVSPGGLVGTARCERPQPEPLLLPRTVNGLLLHRHLRRVHERWRMCKAWNRLERRSRRPACRWSRCQAAGGRPCCAAEQTARCDGVWAPASGAYLQPLVHTAVICHRRRWAGPCTSLSGRTAATRLARRPRLRSPPPPPRAFRCPASQVAASRASLAYRGCWPCTRCRLASRCHACLLARAHARRPPAICQKKGEGYAGKAGGAMTIA